MVRQDDSTHRGKDINFEGRLIISFVIKFTHLCLNNLSTNLSTIISLL